MGCKCAKATSASCRPAQCPSIQLETGSPAQYPSIQLDTGSSSKDCSATHVTHEAQVCKMGNEQLSNDVETGTPLKQAAEEHEVCKMGNEQLSNDVEMGTPLKQAADEEFEPQLQAEEKVKNFQDEVNTEEATTDVETALNAEMAVPLARSTSEVMEVKAMCSTSSVKSEVQIQAEDKLENLQAEVMSLQEKAKSSALKVEGLCGEVKSLQDKVKSLEEIVAEMRVEKEKLKVTIAETAMVAARNEQSAFESDVLREALTEKDVVKERMLAEHAEVKEAFEKTKTELRNSEGKCRQLLLLHLQEAGWT